MTTYRTQEQVRNYDLFKGVILSLLLVGLFVAYAVSRPADIGSEETIAQTEPTEGGETAAGAIETADVAVPELFSPAPGSEIEAGPVTFSGMGAPGTQIAITASGQELGRTQVADNGTWEVEVDVPAGTSAVELQAIGGDGQVLASAPAIPMTFVEAAESAVEQPFAVDPLPMDAVAPLTVSGSGVPGSEVAVDIGGEQVATAVVGDDGRWSVEIPAGDYSGEVTASELTAEGEEAPSASAGQLPSGAATEPALNLPDGQLRAGNVSLSGTGQPGTSLKVLANGVDVGTAEVAADGTWSLETVLPAAEYAVDLITLDADGNPLATTPAATIPVLEAAETAEGEAQTPAEGEPAETAEGESGETAEGESGETAEGEPAETTEGESAETAEGETQESTAVEPPTLEEADTPVESLANSGDFDVLVRGLEAAGLSGSLADVEESFTLFAPVDEAFDTIPADLKLGWQFNPEAYQQLMRYLVVEGKYLPEDLTDGQVLQTLEGTNIGITRVGDQIAVSGVPVIGSAEVGNSVVYALPLLILPPLPSAVARPLIDDSGVPFFTGPDLTVVGTAEPGDRIVLTVDGERFGEIATVQPDGSWQISGQVGSNVRRLVAYMIDANGLLTAISNEVLLPVPQQP